LQGSACHHPPPQLRAALRRVKLCVGGGGCSSRSRSSRLPLCGRRNAAPYWYPPNVPPPSSGTAADTDYSTFDHATRKLALLCELRLLTGGTHQLRVQRAHELDASIQGDGTYGGPDTA